MVAEMLMVVLAVILAVAFVVGFQSNVSSNVGSKDLATVYVWTSVRNNWVNITAINSGGDAIAITGHLYIQYSNGTAQPLDAELAYNNTVSDINGDFRVRQLAFGQQFHVNIDSSQLSDGTIHYMISSKNQILAEVEQNIETHE